MEAAGIFTSPPSLPAGPLMMDRRAVKRAGLSQRKTDVSLQFSVSAVAIEITRPLRGEDVLVKTGGSSALPCAGPNTGCTGLLSKALSSHTLTGSQSSCWVRKSYASEIVLTAVNRLCRVRQAVSQRADFCKQLSVATSSLRTLTYSRRG